MSGIVENIFDDKGTIVAQCSKCLNLKRGTFTCKAFPDEIPDEIIKNEFKHTKPYPGDNGYRLKLK